MSGAAPAVDSSGNLYVSTGNGAFDANSLTPPNNDYGDSLLQLTPSLGVNQYFTPSDQAADYNRTIRISEPAAPRCSPICRSAAA